MEAREAFLQLASSVFASQTNSGAISSEQFVLPDDNVEKIGKIFMPEKGN